MLLLKEEKYNGKKSNKRLTGVADENAYGNRLSMFVIGKSEN